MPDWSYRPLFAPWMLRCPGLSHALVLRKMRLIGASPLLYRIIDLMGHMRPPASLRRRVAGLDVASPLGMGAVIDRCGRAFRAYERFGFGFVEIGPVAHAGTPARASVDRAARAIKDPEGAIGLDAALKELKAQIPRTATRRIVRLAATDAPLKPESAERRAALFALAALADAVLVPAPLAAEAARCGKPWGLSIRLAEVAALRETAGAPLLAVDPDDAVWTPSDRERGLAAVTQLRRRFPAAAILYAAGGIESPRDAVAFLDAGADLISLSHGFVFTGPGTPKRINAAIGAQAGSRPEPTTASLCETARYAWFWCLALGTAMMLGALLAGYFALTRVILPYDEIASGLTREALAAMNPRLLHFMAHDRFTLAGTMLSLGLLYTGLAWHGVRRGRTWAQEAVVFSTVGGFLTFFSFVAYGYFDQFHAFVAASLFPMAIQCAVGRPVDAKAAAAVVDLDNDRAWRRACVGQLCFVAQAIGLLLAGTVIVLVGSTHVFVDSDLAFLGATRDAIGGLHVNLVPLVAHDRATFGGMLLSSGLAVLVAALWGFHRGERWLWWTLAIAGFPAYLATLWIHHDIQYTDLLHLSPVAVGMALHAGGLALSSAYLRQTPGR